MKCAKYSKSYAVIIVYSSYVNLHKYQTNHVKCYRLVLFTNLLSNLALLF